MQTYSKAYPLAELRRFPGWAASATPADHELADEDVGYLGEDLTVLADPIGEQGLLFAAVTPQWRAFCTSELGFEVPADLVGADTDGDQD